MRFFTQCPCPDGASRDCFPERPIWGSCPGRGDHSWSAYDFAAVEDDHQVPIRVPAVQSPMSPSNCLSMSVHAQRVETLRGHLPTDVRVIISSEESSALDPRCRSSVHGA